MAKVLPNMMKYTLTLAALFVASLAFCQQTPVGPTSVAQTPPMGWNSYNAFGSHVLESEVRANADYMAQNLKQYGWQYVVVDFCWSYANPPKSTVGNPKQFRMEDGSYVPWLAMDEYGRLLPDERKFPSAKGGAGFRPLASYVHGLGLKFGIHVMRGIPRQAVWAKTPILGTNGITADMIADTNSTCPWLNHMYGVDMSKPGAQEYYNSLLELYGQWNVDYIKVDDMGLERDTFIYYKDEVAAVRKAIDNLRRPIVFSVSPFQQFSSSEHLRQNANLFRISNDFWDTWEQLKKQFDYCAQWAPVSTSGHWPDADMLQIGKVSKRGPLGPERYSKFTEAEQRTHLSLWCIVKSPLMIGGNMPENTPFVTGLLTNEEALAMNQKGQKPRQVSRENDLVIWTSDDPDGITKNVAVFNLSEEAKPVNLDLSKLGFPKKFNIRDVWAKSYKGQFKKSYPLQLSSHDAVLLRVTAAQ